MAQDRKRPGHKRDFAPGDTWLHSMPVPDAREGGESTWEAWEEESLRMDLAFAPTQPSENLPLADARGARAMQPRTGRWTIEDVLLLARRNNRVCPRPALWAGLYLLLEGDRYADLQPPPTQPWIWNKLSSLQRRMSFREHVEWAERHGKLEEAARYLDSVSEADWVHIGED
jgi:hypothetical protein